MTGQADGASGSRCRSTPPRSTPTPSSIGRPDDPERSRRGDPVNSLQVNAVAQKGRAQLRRDRREPGRSGPLPRLGPDRGRPLRRRSPRLSFRSSASGWARSGKDSGWWGALAISTPWCLQFQHPGPDPAVSALRRGIFELRDLRYGKLPPFGNLKGIASIFPRAGESTGRGRLAGSLPEGPTARPSLAGRGWSRSTSRLTGPRSPRLAMEVPSLLRELDGSARSGWPEGSRMRFEASAEVLVPRPKAFGIPM